jgi:phage virion morphogenesis protein
MPGISIKLTTDGMGVTALLKGMADRLGNPHQPLTDCGVQMIRSTRKNFAAEGRPEKWAPLAKSTIKHKRKTGHTKMLVDKRILENSITSDVQGNTLTHGTASPYGRIHQLGGEIRQGARSELFVRNRYKKGPKKNLFKKGTQAGRGLTFKDRTIKIPARKFLVFQPEDLDIFKKIFSAWAMGKKP